MTARLSHHEQRCCCHKPSTCSVKGPGAAAAAAAPCPPFACARPTAPPPHLATEARTRDDRVDPDRLAHVCLVKGHAVHHGVGHVGALKVGGVGIGLGQHRLLPTGVGQCAGGAPARGLRGQMPARAPHGMGQGTQALQSPAPRALLRRGPPCMACRLNAAPPAGWRRSGLPLTAAPPPASSPTGSCPRTRTCAGPKACRTRRWPARHGDGVEGAGSGGKGGVRPHEGAVAACTPTKLLAGVRQLGHALHAGCSGARRALRCAVGTPSRGRAKQGQSQSAGAPHLADRVADVPAVAAVGVCAGHGKVVSGSSRAGVMRWRQLGGGMQHALPVCALRAADWQPWQRHAPESRGGSRNSASAGAAASREAAANADAAAAASRWPVASCCCLCCVLAAGGGGAWGGGRCMDGVHGSGADAWAPPARPPA